MSLLKPYTGVLVVDNFDKVDELYSNGYVSIETSNITENIEAHKKLYQNMCLVLKGGKQSVLGIVKGSSVVHIKEERLKFFNTVPKNKEQRFASQILSDDDIKLKLITGVEGTGKNYLTASVVLHKLLDEKRYDRLILTKTTDEVGKSLGLFPGSAEEKFANYLYSFSYTFENVVKRGQDYLSVLFEKRIVEYIPIQLMRGVSFPARTLVWCDEAAGLSQYELRMLGTRLGQDCALVLTGSFEQIDRKIKERDTGMWQLVNSERIKDSPLAATINLVKNERSELSTLISEVL